METFLIKKQNQKKNLFRIFHNHSNVPLEKWINKYFFWYAKYGKTLNTFTGKKNISPLIFLSIMNKSNKLNDVQWMGKYWMYKNFWGWKIFVDAWEFCWIKINNFLHVFWMKGIIVYVFALKIRNKFKNYLFGGSILPNWGYFQLIYW